MIYLDNAATTAMDARVLEEMFPYFMEEYGNPNAGYSLGRVAKQAIHLAEKRIKKALDAENYHVIFTSSGTEANNIAIELLLEHHAGKGKHIISSQIEHPSVGNTLEYYKKLGYEVTEVSVDENGFFFIEEVKAAIRKDTVLLSLMYVNNEVGSIQNLEEIQKLCQNEGIAFHADCIQNLPYVEISLSKVPMQACTISAHKFYGPKGIAALLLDKSIKKRSLIHGGNSASIVRAGTDNVPAIVGMGKAVELCAMELKQNQSHVQSLQEYLIYEIEKQFADRIFLNGTMANRSLNNISLWIKNYSSVLLIAKLDMQGICVSAGAACSAGTIQPSKTIEAMYPNTGRAKESIRVSLGKYNTREELDVFLLVLHNILDESKNR